MIKNFRYNGKKFSQSECSLKTLKIATFWLFIFIVGFFCLVFFAQNLGIKSVYLERFRTNFGEKSEQILAKISKNDKNSSLVKNENLDSNLSQNLDENLQTNNQQNTNNTSKKRTNTKHITWLDKFEEEAPISKSTKRLINGLFTDYFWDESLDKKDEKNITRRRTKDEIIAQIQGLINNLNENEQNLTNDLQIANKSEANSTQILSQNLNKQTPKIFTQNEANFSQFSPTKPSLNLSYLHDLNISKNAEFSLQNLQNDGNFHFKNLLKIFASSDFFTPVRDDFINFYQKMDENLSKKETKNSHTKDDLNSQKTFNPAQKSVNLKTPAKKESPSSTQNSQQTKPSTNAQISTKKSQNSLQRLANLGKNKPKLAIIVDDMATAEQVRQLKATNLKLIPSFFPPDRNHPRTPILAREFDFFMVHLPLSALSYKNEELSTLGPADSQEHIDAAVARIVRDFKGIRFINNHTGSLFTQDLNAMRRLFKAFKAHDLVFVDSMTSGASKGAFVASEFSQKPIKRDIFLDNSDDVEIIKGKIREAVELATHQGFAIAIAHPKNSTFRALRESKDLLNLIDLIYLDEIYE